MHASIACVTLPFSETPPLLFKATSIILPTSQLPMRSYLHCSQSCEPWVRFKLGVDYCLDGSLQKERQKGIARCIPTTVHTQYEQFYQRKHECPALGLWHRVLQKLEKEEPINLWYAFCAKLVHLQIVPQRKPDQHTDFTLSKVQSEDAKSIR